MPTDKEPIARKPVVKNPVVKKRRGRTGLTLASLIVLAACGLLVLPASDRPSSSNRALADADATTKVIGDVSNALTKVFSYTPEDTAGAERAASQTLAGRAADDHRRLFAEVKQQAPAQRLALNTRVVRAGVVTLTGDTARLLVFLDQAATRAGEPSGSVAPAQLSVMAALRDGQWRITELKAR
ncbi:hypothetical protein [Actinomadura sp. 9N407]|uniref:hypothetical protein n=1 Tax=Actinomadura sp. 9N407 TaxID=3375154 RepID=UPI003794FCE2